MCGFVGFVNYGNKDLLSQATKIIAHRGPDNQSEYWDDGAHIGLGHRRLSIIDLSQESNQPFWNDNKNLVIVYNGEIFNYLEIREMLHKKGVSFRTKSDTEVLLKGFELLGESILEHLNGMFAFIIYNKKTREIFAARDHIGIKPFYYYKTEQGLICSSEIKSILTAVKSIQPDYRAISTPIHFQTAPETGFSGIKKLKPAELLRFKDKKLTTETYWRISAKTPDQSSFEDKKEALNSLLLDAVEKQMLSDVPVGVMLSGGLDSSLIGALMSKKTTKPINSFTIKIDQDDLKQQGIVDDSFYARQVAEDFGFNHNEINIKPNIIELLPKMVYHLEEILVDPAAINTYLISDMAKNSGISVLLSGIGADEIFAGYRIHKAMDSFNSMGAVINNPLVKNVSKVFRNVPESLPLVSTKYVRWFKKICFLLSLDVNKRHLLAKDAAFTPDVWQKAFTSDPDYFDLNYPKQELDLFKAYDVSYLNKLCLSDTNFYLPNHNLNYLDKSMMAASIEGRPPLIDKRIVEFAFRCKDEDKIRNGRQKYILKELSMDYLKPNIIDRPKAPFAAPLRSWLKKDLKEMVFDLVNKTTIENRGVYNFSYVEKVLIDHYRGVTDNSQVILRLLVTELWFQSFFDKKL